MSAVRGQSGHGLPSTCKLPGTHAVLGRHGRIVSERKSGTLQISGSCGPWPTSPQANPAKPAPSRANSSMCETGTSLAFGAPVNSTNEQNTYSTPFSVRCDLRVSLIFYLRFQCDTAAAAFSPTRFPVSKRAGENG